jgi:hypothetical protein
MGTNYGRDTRHELERFQRTHAVTLGRRRMDYELRMLSGSTRCRLSPAMGWNGS